MGDIMYFSDRKQYAATGETGEPSGRLTPLFYKDLIQLSNINFLCSGERYNL